jgi:hypothetical protein
MFAIYTILPQVTVDDLCEYYIRNNFNNIILNVPLRLPSPRILEIQSLENKYIFLNSKIRKPKF